MALWPLWRRGHFRRRTTAHCRALPGPIEQPLTSRLKTLKSEPATSARSCSSWAAAKRVQRPCKRPPREPVTSSVSHLGREAFTLCTSPPDRHQQRRRQGDSAEGESPRAGRWAGGRAEGSLAVPPAAGSGDRSPRPGHMGTAAATSVVSAGRAGPDCLGLGFRDVRAGLAEPGPQNEKPLVPNPTHASKHLSGGQPQATSPKQHGRSPGVLSGASAPTQKPPKAPSLVPGVCNDSPSLPPLCERAPLGGGVNPHFGHPANGTWSCPVTREPPSVPVGTRIRHQSIPPSFPASRGPRCQSQWSCFRCNQPCGGTSVRCPRSRRG